MKKETITKLFLPEFQEFLRKCVEVGKDRLYLNFWRINLEYVREVKSHGGDENITFEICIDHMYMEATVYVSLLAQRHWQSGKKAYIARDMLHELCHIITEPLADFAKERMAERDHDMLLHLEENLTQRIAMLL